MPTCPICYSEVDALAIREDALENAWVCRCLGFDLRRCRTCTQTHSGCGCCGCDDPGGEDGPGFELTADGRIVWRGAS